MLSEFFGHLAELVGIIKHMHQKGKRANSSLCHPGIPIVDQLQKQGDEKRASNACLDMAGNETNNLDGAKVNV